MKRLATLTLALLAASQLSACFPLVVAGVGTGVAVAQDRRATSVVLNDQEIENGVARSIGNKYGKLTHVNVTSYNRSVLLTGEVPDDAARADVERLAAQIEGVRKVYNEVVVMLPSSLAARTGDAALTTRIKAAMTGSNRVSPLHVKVVTERSQVFLLGLVKQDEGTAAAEIASQTSGVEKVVTLFEYTD
ncbi:BON domain-containing protein [Chitinimonas koreensis]|uniref:BON domain-containing protein n=1 Tax=Chitinimonas koreensis TaxID=356302 RepID=UPI0003FD628C|nr:BON domain-containing protein [Chitinimonas koreensis]QNM97946.1 BON domain-containing protein [Chitinimonas koreensis]